MTTDVRTTVVVDLIGDLDLALVATFVETVSPFAGDPSTDILVSTRHLDPASGEAVRALDTAIAGFRKRGIALSLDPGNRKMKTALSGNVAIAAIGDEGRAGARRHLMLARHAQKGRLRRTA